VAGAGFIENNFGLPLGGIHNPRKSSPKVLSNAPAKAAIVLSRASVRPLSTSNTVFNLKPLDADDVAPEFRK
jgi:hypothetical protein